MDIHCFVPRGFDGHLVTVEVDIRRGIPGTDIVGLPGGAVREARERVRTATRNVGLVYPQDRVIINLVPAGIPKVGASFDLAIALAVLHASGQLPSRGYPAILALGELQLNGSLRPVSGVLAAIVAAREAGIRHVVLPYANVAEASIISGLLIRGAGTLEEAVAAAQSELLVAHLVARPVDFGYVTLCCLDLLAVQADVVGFQRADFTTTAIAQMREHLGSAVDIFGGVEQVGAAAETAPVVGTHLRGTDGAHMGSGHFAKCAFGVHQAGQQIGFETLAF
ncbi:MAG: hypothetical protein GVY29_05585, partial [Spirochaetes bacterium]|nr:hypothetical protein [Spirochaetota bacterium]